MLAGEPRAAEKMQAQDSSPLGFLGLLPIELFRAELLGDAGRRQGILACYVRSLCTRLRYEFDSSNTSLTLDGLRKLRAEDLLRRMPRVEELCIEHDDECQHAMTTALAAVASE